MASKALPKIGDDYALAIGKLVVIAGEIETALVNLMAGFIQADIIATLIVAGHQQASSKADTLLALMRMRLGDDAQFEPIFDIIKSARKSADFRNTIIHCIWARDEETNEIMAVRFSARGKFQRSRTPISLKEIQEQIASAELTLGELHRLSEHFRAAPIPSLEPG